MSPLLSLVPARSAHVRVAGVHVALGGRPVLAGVDLVAAAGDRVAVVGENGRGKTTLLRVLAGDLPVDRGDVRRAGSVGVADQQLPLGAADTVGDLIDLELAVVRDALDRLARTTDGLVTVRRGRSPVPLWTSRPTGKGEQYFRRDYGHRSCPRWIPGVITVWIGRPSRLSQRNPREGDVRDPRRRLRWLVAVTDAARTAEVTGVGAVAKVVRHSGVVSGSREAATGASVGKSGSTTGVTEGTIGAKNQTVPVNRSCPPTAWTW